MHEKPKSIWKRSWKGPHGLFLGFLLLATAVFIIFVIGVAVEPRLISNETTVVAMTGLVISMAFGLVGIFAAWFIRWLFCRHNFKRFVFGLACVITLIALFYAEEDWRGKHDWEKFKRVWGTKGEHFDYASVVPPSVPGEQNFALTPVVASCYEAILDKNGKHISPSNTNVVNRLELDINGNNHNWSNWPTNGNWIRQTKTDLRGWQQYYRAMAAKTNEFQIPAQPQSPAQDVLLALSKYDSVIEDLRQASQLPYSRFPLNYDAEHPFATLLPHLAAMKRCSQALQLRAIAELQAGKTDQALADVKLSLRLIESFRTEPFLISELVRIAMTEITLQPIYEGLAEHRWSDEQLVVLNTELGKLDFLADFQSVMRGERAGEIAIIDHFRKLRDFREFAGLLSSISPDDGNETLAKEATQSLYATGFFLMPDGWFYQNELDIARLQQPWISSVVAPENHLVLTKKYRETEETASDWSKQPARPWNFFAKLILPALGRAAIKSAREQISVDLARMAIALERYRLAHGEFPESLDALTPQFIAQVPQDVIGGQPLHYRRSSDGQFILYSVGWNEKDDGGVTGHRNGGTAPDFESGDWVWRYPKAE
jgi:hypothetical protein